MQNIVISKIHRNKHVSKRKKNKTNLIWQVLLSTLPFADVAKAKLAANAFKR